MKICTERLIIEETDYDKTIKIRESNSGDSVYKHLATLNEKEISLALSDKEALSALLSRLTSIRNGNKILYGARKGNKLIGYISIVNDGSSIPEVQIEFEPEFQGQGYGYEFLSALLKELFKNNKYMYLRYTVLPNNIASIKLIEKIGAELQSPCSELEKLLMRTYYISKQSMCL